MNKSLRFIDLYAGLGGFHQALAVLGHRCVFASEIDEDLADLYEKNFGIRPHGDIRAVKIESVPDRTMGSDSIDSSNSVTISTDTMKSIGNQSSLTLLLYARRINAIR